MVTIEQAYRPVLWKQPNEMTDRELEMAEFQLRTRNVDKQPEKKDEILSALSMVRDEMSERKIKSFEKK